MRAAKAGRSVREIEILFIFVNDVDGPNSFFFVVREKDYESNLTHLKIPDGETNQGQMREAGRSVSQ